VPFPTDTDGNAQVAVDRLVAIARAVRADAVRYISQCDSGSVNAHDLISAFTVNHLVPARALWDQLRAISGVPAEVRRRFPGAFADDAGVEAAMANASAEMASTITYAVTNTPTDGGGWVLTLSISGNQFVQRVVTNAAQRANLKARLVALRDAFSP
jgi:hypothetical protein